MSKDEKHVIPKYEYKRKRREYFHNEEREQRVKEEQHQKEQQAIKEEQLAKNNEERVKDNLRKARIEKLTQEEIQQQQALAAKRSQQTTYDKDHQNQSENQEETHKVDDQSNDSSVHGVSDKQKNLDTVNQTQNETKQKANLNEDSEHTKSNGDASSVNIKTGNKQSAYKEDVNGEHQVTDVKSKEHNQGFFAQHWPKVAIVVAVIILLLLIKAIFGAVNHNKHVHETAYNYEINTNETNEMHHTKGSEASAMTLKNRKNDKNISEKQLSKNKQQNEFGTRVWDKIDVSDSLSISETT